jgi:hypothetical protein
LEGPGHHSGDPRTGGDRSVALVRKTCHQNLVAFS